MARNYIMVTNQTIKVKSYFINLCLKCFLRPFPGTEEAESCKMRWTNRNWCDLEGALGVRCGGLDGGGMSQSAAAAVSPPIALCLSAPATAVSQTIETRAQARNCIWGDFLPSPLHNLQKD